VKLTQAVSPQLREGAFVVHKFCSTAVMYPLLFAIGVSLTSLGKLAITSNLPTEIIIVSTVATLMAMDASVEYRLKMYPIAAAIVNFCHSGQGGTGDVAIRTAANRMTLMPFAQIATRISGAINLTTVLIVLSRIS
jgi:Na+/citrate or Na+/malate symporter